MTDSAWDRIAPLPLAMYAPAFRGRPAEQTEIRVVYDDEYLYASGRFYDSRPEGFRANSLYRDRWTGQPPALRHRPGAAQQRARPSWV